MWMADFRSRFSNARVIVMWAVAQTGVAIEADARRIAWLAFLRKRTFSY